MAHNKLGERNPRWKNTVRKSGGEIFGVLHSPLGQRIYDLQGTGSEAVGQVCGLQDPKDRGSEAAQPFCRST